MNADLVLSPLTYLNETVLVLCVFCLGGASVELCDFHIRKQRCPVELVDIWFRATHTEAQAIEIISFRCIFLTAPVVSDVISPVYRSSLSYQPFMPMLRDHLLTEQCSCQLYLLPLDNKHGTKVYQIYIW